MIRKLLRRKAGVLCRAEETFVTDFLFRGNVGLDMKLCNGINDTRKTWQGARAYASEDSTALANDIAAFCLMQN